MLIGARFSHKSGDGEIFTGVSRKNCTRYLGFSGIKPAFDWNSRRPDLFMTNKSTDPPKKMGTSTVHNRRHRSTRAAKYTGIMLATANLSRGCEQFRGIAWSGIARMFMPGSLY